MGDGAKRILLVEDDEDLVALLALVLRGRGYRVDTAGNGREALEVLDRRGLPDLILLDMRMPVMNGWEFAAEFEERHDHLAPIVVVTAAEDARRRAEEIGAAGWIGKPFDVDDLLDEVALHAGGDRGAAPRPPA
jgi:CheY-like chemotaxis protein